MSTEATAISKPKGKRPEPPPCDAFAALLRRLRERKGYTAAGLSVAMYHTPNYFHLWECKPGYPIKRSTLLRTCDFLQVRDSERRRLLQLADERLMEHSR